MLILISVSVKIQERILVEEAERKLEQTADVIQVTLDVLLNTRQQSLLNLAENLQRWDQVQHPTLADDAALKQLFDHLWVINVNGDVVDEWPSLGAVREHLNVSQQSMFTKVKNGSPFVLTAPQPSYYNNEPVVHAVVPMFEHDGSFLGAVVGAFSLHNNIVLNQIVTTRIGRSGYVAIADNQGYLVGHPDRRLIGLRLGPDQSPLLHRAIDHGWEGVGRTPGAQGDEMIQAVRPLRSGHWIVGVQMSVNEAMEPAHQVRNIQWALGGAALLVSLILLSIILNSYLGPLRRLKDEVEAIQTGKQKQLTEPGINELRQLVYRFNNLLAQNETTQQTLRQRQAYLDQILATSSVGLFMADTQGRIQYVNQRLTEITGYSAEELKRDGFVKQLTAAQRSNFVAQMRHALEFEISVSIEIQLRHHEGNLVWLRIETSPVKVESKCIGHVGTITDTTSQRATIDELHHAAHEDTLTGVLNRRGIEKVMSSAFERARKHEQSLLVVALDLDNFKQVNDTFGHAYGDYVLVEVAKLMGRFTRDSDFVGRIGGDEFIIGLPNCPLERGERMAEELIRGMQSLKTPQQEPAGVSVSIGISAINKDDQNYLAIIKRADHAAYEAKRMGRNRYVSN
ncbi:MAG: diguanylate cyclase [Idiomarina sp.]|nr:diguanylate cyclase [Idiomarina sp.]